MIEELKPCPFCGGSAVLQDSFHYMYPKNVFWTIFCSKGYNYGINECLVSPELNSVHSKEEAIRTWNTRYSD